MKRSLYKLKYWFPKYNIICAGDLNGTFELSTIKNDIGDEIKMNGKSVKIIENPEVKEFFQHTRFNVFPSLGKGITVCKRRTMMQLQRKKAN